MPTMSPPLRVAVLGVGKIGSAFAFQLARVGGHAVTVVARPGSARLARLQHDQAIINVKGERAEVRVVESLDEETPYDLVIVTLLAHQIEPLLPTLQRSAAGSIQFMFNTFEPEQLQAAIGPERCAFGMPFVQATLDAEGDAGGGAGANAPVLVVGRTRSARGGPTRIGRARIVIGSLLGGAVSR